MKSNNKAFFCGLVVMPLVLLGLSVAIASNVEPLSKFVPGAVVSSGEVNSHLDRLRLAINDNDARISAIESGSTVISVNALDGKLANELLRASYVEDRGTIDDFSGTMFSPIITNSVNVPGPGILLIWGSVTAEWDPNSVAGTFNRLLTRFTVDSIPAGPLFETEFRDEGVSDTSGKVTTLTAAVPVAAAGAVTLDLEARTQIGSALLFIRDRNLTTLFVPYGNSGMQGVLTKPTFGGGK